MATISTPLDAVVKLLDPDVSVWLLSAGGGNVDILAAMESLARREPRQMAVLCGREGSQLAGLAHKHDYVDLLVFPPPAGRDGFLATNSLLGFTALLMRAYASECGEPQAWDQAVAAGAWLVEEAGEELSALKAACADLWPRQTTLVLHGPNTALGAIDLESKFTEAAIGNVQLADYRNFAHGRHHWLAKRGDASAVLAFVTDADRALAERTLALVPPDIPRVCVHLSGGPMAANLSSLSAALRITEWAGQARGIDPGRPGVPDFGRKLYNLPLPKPRAARLEGMSDRDEAAIHRKTGKHPQRLHVTGELGPWTKAPTTFRQSLQAQTFLGVVLDYDGTVVDTRRRFEPPCNEMSAQLVRVIEGGARLAIATGRGKSVRQDLQARLPRSLWDRVLVGYYNGADIAALDDEQAPAGGTKVCDALADVAEALRRQPGLVGVAEQTDRPRQITLEAKVLMSENRLWDLTHHVLLQLGRPEIAVTRSSHSIDILAPGTSKLNVLQVLEERLQDAPVLAIGDRGRWPGNDHELLAGAYSLSVDEVSPDPATCWNLGSRGQRGPAITLEYLAALRPEGDGLRLAEGAVI